MYCKNCGSAMDDNSAVCINCGTMKGQGDRFCVNCGSELKPGADVCLSCGFATQGNKGIGTSGAKSKMAAGLLGIFLGGFGIHNFYLGYTTRGIIQLILTVCSCGIGSIWGFVEGILILCGSINTDADGNPLGD
ncbi:MAG: TM2 domain-containing protein [Ruminococcus flavefaciens]|nr:TM2 domain-containing protein [Ruminococcus flavefaciens]MCM1229612.1 TM2 domain-containing protein [Ruminococcus flavefaciens]